jgi:DeoR family suf operon transcriptional repressor
MSATRDEIVGILRRKGTASVNDLAAATGVTPVSIRHHLASLQADGLISAVEAHIKVGRPKLVYSLTQTALERFPTKYLKLTDQLLDEIKSAIPASVMDHIFAAIAQNMAAEHASKFEGKPLKDKMALLVKVLGEEGFMAAWNKVGDSYQLTEYNCPYLAIGQRHPEVCTIDQTLISQVLNTPVEKTTCLLNGDQRCVFVIHPTQIQVADTP